MNRKKLKNIILKGITAFAFIFGVCLACGVEPQTEGQMLFVMAGLALSWGWVFLFCYINGLM